MWDTGPEHERGILRYQIVLDDASAIQSLAERAVHESADLSPEGYLRRVAVLSHDLPESIREALVDFRLSGYPLGGFVVSGLPLDQNALGPTPQSTSEVVRTPGVRQADAMLLLLASILGDVFSHAGVQNGRVVLNICPAPGDEHTQLASSSSGGLDWHIEDAFHEFRADWILLMCLRNPSQVATTFASVRDAALTEAVSNLLFEERFLISPDSSHAASTDLHTTRRIAVLSGDRRAPYVCLDPAFMTRDLDDAAAEKALVTAIEAFDGNLRDVVLAPGEIFIIDNLRAVHGRRPFDARYDGTDRWLRMVNVTADLRKSAGRRSGSHGRALIA